MPRSLSNFVDVFSYETKSGYQLRDKIGALWRKWKGKEGKYVKNPSKYLIKKGYKIIQRTWEKTLGL